MKKAFAILLSLSFLLQCSGYLLIYIQFKANQDYIAKNLCENRDRPEMKCNGKCQLCKRLKAEDKKENKGLPALKNLKLFSLFSSPKNIFNFKPSNDASKFASLHLNDISISHKRGVSIRPWVNFSIYLFNPLNQWYWPLDYWYLNLNFSMPDNGYLN